MEHIEIPAGERHPPFNWKVADETARLALVLASDELDCVALQLDTSELWRLVSIGPAVWAPVAPDRTYTHDQPAAATTWTVPHGLRKFPTIQVVDSAGTEVGGVVTHVSNLVAQIEFSLAFSGKAHCN